MRGEIDFASRTADLAFKFAAKSSRPSRLIVSGRLRHFTPKVVALLEDGKLFSLAELIRADYPRLEPQYAAQAEALELSYGYVVPRIVEMRRTRDVIARQRRNNFPERAHDQGDCFACCWQ